MEDSIAPRPEEDLDALEAHLAGTLKPVAPPSDLVQRLRDRIRLPARGAIALRFQDWRRLFVVFGGVMSVLLVLLTVARALFHLVGRRHM
jgi:hypothetical protein